MDRLRRAVKALFASYIVTGVFLLILALIMYKANPGPGVIRVGIIFAYIFSPFIGGIIMGKNEKSRRFLWGLVLGLAYFGVIFLVAFVMNQNVFGQGASILTVLAMSALGGMLGGMIS